MCAWDTAAKRHVSRTPGGATAPRGTGTEPLASDGLVRAQRREAKGARGCDEGRPALTRTATEACRRPFAVAGRRLTRAKE